MSDIFKDIQDSLEHVDEEFSTFLSNANTTQDIEHIRVKFLGRKSAVSVALKQLGGLAADQRAKIGKRTNILRASFESKLTAHREALAAQIKQTPNIDVTLPGSLIDAGRLHPITQTLDSILSVFIPMGFEIVEGPEMEFEAYNFDRLNIPRDHPSRESFDTFFIDTPFSSPKHGGLLLRSHTSPVQIRVMEKRKPPLRVVVPGKVFRPDSVDPSHSFMFHQVEGLMVDDHTNFADLKGMLDRFLISLFGPKTRTRFRPHYFPFTEPSAEVDIACSVCNGAGCSTCGRKGWVEIMGCGMVHPNVLRGVGYNPAKVQGFAFGLGVERIAMLRHGIKDIRLFFENDVRFLEQF